MSHTHKETFEIYHPHNFIMRKYLRLLGMILGVACSNGRTKFHITITG
jgi:hypothetical protein